MTHGANTAHGMNTVTNSRFAFIYPANNSCLVFRVSHAPEMSRDGVTICAAGRDWEYGDTAR